MQIYILVAFVVVAWLIACVSSSMSISLSVARSSGRSRLPLVLAVVATVIGYVGYGHWSPFRFFPQIGYSWSSDSFEFRINSSWFFLAPLFLGLTAVGLAVWRQSRSSNAT